MRCLLRAHISLKLIPMMSVLPLRHPVPPSLPAALRKVAPGTFNAQYPLLFVLGVHWLDSAAARPVADAVSDVQHGVNMACRNGGRHPHTLAATAGGRPDKRIFSWRWQMGRATETTMKYKLSCRVTSTFVQLLWIVAYPFIAINRLERREQLRGEDARTNPTRSPGENTSGAE